MSGYKGSIKSATSSDRRTGNIVQQKVANQSVGKSQMGNSSPVSVACGSGSRPTKSHYTIESSAPKMAQQIRPSNAIDKTPGYGK